MWPRGGGSRKDAVDRNYVECGTGSGIAPDEVECTVRAMRLRFSLFFFLLLTSVCSRAAEPLPYVTEDALGLKFEQPIGLVSPPGETERLFVLEKPGRILVITDLAHPRPHVFLDLRSRVGSAESEQGVLALAFHPDYRHNRQFYVWYTSAREVQGKTVREDRLARFQASPEDPDVADPRSEQILIAQADRADNHNGGELAFGPDGYLYLSLGDEGRYNDDFDNAQRIDRNFFAGILRLDVDQRPGSVAPNPHPAVRAGTYTVPADNPFVGATTFNGQAVDPQRVRTEFWAVGLRNPWRMAFDPVSGALWCGDVGQDKWEEVNVIKRGGNYGWHLREGRGHFRGDEPAGARFDEPVWVYPHPEGLSITGGVFSHGAGCPGLKGKYLFADYVTNRIWSLAPAGDQPVGADRVQLIAQGDTVVSFGRDPRNGDILLASIRRGRILRLVPAPAR
jgi:glucose/arabinose dehydrogenase